MQTHHTRHVIYGAGTTGRRALDILRHQGKEILGFIDAASKRIGSVENLPVYTIQQAAQTPGWKDPGTVVVVAVFNPLASMRLILSDLGKAGFENVVDFFSFYRAHSQEIGDLYWLTSDRGFYERNAGNIAKLRSMLIDEKSRALLDQSVKFRTSLNLNDLPVAEGVTSQYFPDDIPIRREAVYFVDCGAYDGDTVSALSGYFKSVKGFDCFEPDPANYSKMVERLDNLFQGEAVHKRYHLCGVTDKQKTLRFHPLGAGGRLSEDGEIAVNCVALDEVLPLGVEHAYLKMDIEGSEMEALHGGKKFIKNGVVDVAVCIYHNPSHLWEVPFYLSSLHSDYRFYLRLYGENLMESVLYGVRAH